MGCAACGKPYEEETAGLPAGPRLASAIAGMCVSCVAESFGTEWWQCLPFYPEVGDRVIHWKHGKVIVDHVENDQVIYHPALAQVHDDNPDIYGVDWWDSFEPIPIDLPT